ncbi:MSCRAMM family adhesin SdrC, partial [Staphylococcus epidermidis]|uniref:MSCRAMM family adhesin SdrC n=1 Tax=Staphylococcus epidermidis TaxID=1282 RepID=UPI0021B1DA52
PHPTSKSLTTHQHPKYQFHPLKNPFTYKITFQTPQPYTPTLKHSPTNPPLHSQPNSLSLTINPQHHMTIHTR